MEQRGFLDQNALIIIGLLVFLGVAWFVSGGPERFESTKPFIYPLPPVGSGGVYGPGDEVPSGRTTNGESEGGVSNGGGQGAPGNESPHAGLVRLSRGNASREDDPAREYIEIRYAGSRSAQPIVISGWTLANSEQSIGVGGTRNTVPSEFVTIPQGTVVVRNDGFNDRAPITFNPGDRAILSTGEAPDVFPAFFKTSFRENKCLGYVADAFPFTPNISNRCPDPIDFPGASSAENACYEFIDRRVRSCGQPTFEEMQDAELSNSCRVFIQDSYTYQGCVAAFENAPDFLEDRWRIYLDHRGSELWDNVRETVYLFDEQGRLVDTLSYD